jgi:hypothetical protein
MNGMGLQYTQPPMAHRHSCLEVTLSLNCHEACYQILFPQLAHCYSTLSTVKALDGPYWKFTHALHHFNLVSLSFLLCATTQASKLIIIYIGKR